MIRNLKVLLAAAMALMALGAVSATGAHAAEEKFHCSVEPCTFTLNKDGLTTTAHHVFVVKGETHTGVKEASLSFTCNQLTGEYTSATKTFTEAKLAGTAYDVCKIAGEPFTVNMTSCFYRFTSAGGGTATGSVVHLECANAGDGVDIVINGVTCLKVTPLTATGVKYHDAGAGEVEATAEVTNIAIPAASVDIENTENVNCKNLIGLRKIESATYTTGHTNITGETDPGGVMASAWFT